jgi:hypothetical protein
MIKITKELEKCLLRELNGEIGHYSEFGAVIGDNEFVLVYGEGDAGDIHLAHISEFEQKGFFIRLKEKKC